jgi:hypothetical protein
MNKVLFSDHQSTKSLIKEGENTCFNINLAKPFEADVVKYTINCESADLSKW